VHGDVENLPLSADRCELGSQLVFGYTPQKKSKDIVHYDND
jgi:hypothetical protein